MDMCAHNAPAHITRVHIHTHTHACTYAQTSLCASDSISMSLSRPSGNKSRNITQVTRLTMKLTERTTVHQKGPGLLPALNLYLLFNWQANYSTELQYYTTGLLNEWEQKCSQRAQYSAWHTTDPKHVLAGNVSGKTPCCKERGLCGQKTWAKTPILLLTLSSSPGLTQLWSSYTWAVARSKGDNECCLPVWVPTNSKC